MEANTTCMTEDASLYDAYIQDIRKTEYPQIKDGLYLDHAGSTICSKRLMDKFHATMMAEVFGNPHSASSSSLRSTQEIESTRNRALLYFGFDPDLVELVFTSNTTAAIKLVAEAFREHDNGFWFGYHVDAHTSIVGVREFASSQQCFTSDAAVELWLQGDCRTDSSQFSKLFAYPAQSNMDGRRLPKEWIAYTSDRTGVRRVYTLYDAASLAATTSLDFKDSNAIPDFTVLSFAKAFGFPNLAALVVRKDAAHIFDRRRYFGGGTVDMVVCAKERWHVRKSGPVYERLEDGTLPVQSILALHLAMQAHAELFGSMAHTSWHTIGLASRLHRQLSELVHGNGKPLCTIYGRGGVGASGTHGPIVAFNMQDQEGQWISNAEVEKLANISNIHLRTGGLCNPGGIATALGLEPWEMRENFSAGLRCGSENDIRNGKPTGIIRVSLGAMSTRNDVDRFVDFVREYFAQRQAPVESENLPENSISTRFFVESLMVYPVKSCAGWQVPYGKPWDVHPEGLAWDREWCIVKQSTGSVLSQKNHPRMALIRPQLDFEQNVLRLEVAGSSDYIEVPLSRDPTYFAIDGEHGSKAAYICGDTIRAQPYTSQKITEFCTRAIGIPCSLARFPPVNACTSGSVVSSRHSKPHLQTKTQAHMPRPLLLSNESPILTISRSSLNRLNEVIKAHGGKAASAAVFRANIVLAERQSSLRDREQPWTEDSWTSMTIYDSEKQGMPGGVQFDLLGGCRRCQMLCIDQQTSEKNAEPFVTLAKIRRIHGKVLFGVHTALCVPSDKSGHRIAISVGDAVVPVF